jgi:L-cysteine desulfidase
MTDTERILALLKQEVAPVMGCTKLFAAVLVAAYATQLLPGKLHPEMIYIQKTKQNVMLK